MPTLRERWELPLFAKELTDSSGQRKTYLVRGGYAFALSLSALAAWWLMLPQGSASFTAGLKIGPAIGHWIYSFQAGALTWLWPIMACTALSVEKERNTLPLLLLTRLGPLTIVLEKFLSRLLVVACLLLTSLPLLAFCFGQGGIPYAFILTLTWLLLVQAIEVTAIAVMCSAYCRSTVGALIGTYLICILAKCSTALVGCVISIMLAAERGTSLSLHDFRNAMLESLGLIPSIIHSSLDSALRFDGLPGSMWLRILSVMYAFRITSLLISVGCLWLARWSLIHRTFVDVQESSLKAFVDRVGRWAQRANQNVVTRGRVVISEGRRLPDDDPVAWRERTTRALGQPRYLIGNFLVLEMPITWFLVIAVSRLEGVELLQTIGNMQMYLWAGMSLMICFVVSGLIIQERQKQTLDMLLAMPLTSREIVIQKMAGIERMLWIVSAPLWTCMAFRAYHEGTVAYVLNEAGMLLLYPRIIAWWAMASGIRQTTRLRAIFDALATAAGAMIAGLLIAVISIGFGGLLSLLSLLYPITLLSSNLTVAEFNPRKYFNLAVYVRSSLLWGILNLLIYSAVLWLVRRVGLEVADFRLRGRNPTSEGSIDEPL